MSSPFRTQRRVEFSDTDMAGIMHFSAYFRFMESAEHDLLRHLGMSVFDEQDEVAISWPRVAAKADFSRPARFEELIDIEVRVERLGTKSVTYSFRFMHSDEELARGFMTSVCCRMKESGPPEPMPIPEAIVQRLQGLVDKLTD